MNFGIVCSRWRELWYCVPQTAENLVLWAPDGVNCGKDDLSAAQCGPVLVFNWIVFSLFLEIEFMELFEVFDQ